MRPYIHPTVARVTSPAAVRQQKSCRQCHGGTDTTKSPTEHPAENLISNGELVKSHNNLYSGVIVYSVTARPLYISDKPWAE